MTFHFNFATPAEFAADGLRHAVATMRAPHDPADRDELLADLASCISMARCTGVDRATFIEALDLGGGQTIVNQGTLAS